MNQQIKVILEKHLRKQFIEQGGESLNDAIGSGLCVVALSRNLKLTTTLDRAITQSPCYVPLLFAI